MQLGKVCPELVRDALNLLSKLQKRGNPSLRLHALWGITTVAQTSPELALDSMLFLLQTLMDEDWGFRKVAAFDMVTLVQVSPSLAAYVLFPTVDAPQDG